MDRVTIVTASIPERSELLGKAIQSVAAQTIQTKHLIKVDKSEGVAKVRNQLIRMADTEFIGFLDDDDLLEPNHVELLLNHAWNLDVVIPYCKFDGPPLPEGYCNRPYDREDLRAHGIFPITVLARRQAILDCGGFSEDAEYEDWELWNTMADSGCRFAAIPFVTWTYRTNSDKRRTHQIQGLI